MPVINPDRKGRRGMQVESQWMDFIAKYEGFLNADQELGRRIRLKDAFDTRDVFFGGHPCLPGSGPYPRASIAYDPSDWASKKGYKECALDGREVIELQIEGAFHATVSLEAGIFKVKATPAKDACLSCAMPLELFKNMVLTKHKVIWALCQKTAKVRTGSLQLGLSDWTTVLEVLACLTDMAEMNPDVWAFWTSLKTA